MKRLFILIIMSIFFSSSAGVALAHFGMLMPSDSMVMQNDNRTINVILSFSHPFEGEGMELVEPVVFGVMARKKSRSLEDPKKNQGYGAYCLGDLLHNQAARCLYVLYGAQALLGTSRGLLHSALH